MAQNYLKHVFSMLIVVGIGMIALSQWQRLTLTEQSTSTSTASHRLSNSSTAASLAFTPIEQIKVGMRVAARNPEVSDSERAGFTDPDPATWRKLTLEMVKSNGGVLDIEMIRPVKWIEVHGAAVGKTIELDLPELGAKGPAKVTSIGECPDIIPGLGQVVISTFAHPASHKILNVKIGNDADDAEAETIGVTANHPFWSVEHNAFIPIGMLKPSAQVLTQSGQTKRIVSVFPRPGPSERVYNFEVLGEHVYYVGKQRTLVHNEYVTIYRGVSAEHDYFADAVEGVATPKGLFGGHADPDLHNLGNTNSIFTSWTTNPDEALRWARQVDNPILADKGRVLVQKVNLDDLYQDGKIVYALDRHDEFEILRVGEIEDLTSLSIDDFLDLF